MRFNSTIMKPGGYTLKTIAGLFDSYEDAERAIEKLQNEGITREQISVIARDEVLRERVIGQEMAYARSAGAGALGGTTVGGIIGLIAGVSAITIPGLGPVISAGTLATALGSTAIGAGLGAATGGLIGALTALGIPETDAHVYAEGVQRGGILLTVDADDDHSPAALEALDQANAVDIAARREELRRNGWTGFDQARMP
jgi:uncharacterized membrane protein